MKVRELIEKLQGFPKDYPVVYYEACCKDGYGYGYWDIEYAEIDETKKTIVLGY